MADNQEETTLHTHGRLRAIAFFHVYEFRHALNFGFYRNATQIMKALFDHLLIETLAEFRRLYPPDEKFCIFRDDVDIMVTRSINDMYAGLHAASVMEYHREPIVLPNHYNSEGKVGEMPADWPGAKEYPQYLIDRLSGRPYAMVFAYGAMGLNCQDRGSHQPPSVQIDDFCDGLGLRFPDGIERFTHPGVVFMTLVGEQRGVHFIRTPLQVSWASTFGDSAE